MAPEAYLRQRLGGLRGVSAGLLPPLGSTNTTSTTSSSGGAGGGVGVDELEAWGDLWDLGVSPHTTTTTATTTATADAARPPATGTPPRKPPAAPSSSSSSASSASASSTYPARPEKLCANLDDICTVAGVAHGCDWLVATLAAACARTARDVSKVRLYLIPK